MITAVIVGVGEWERYTRPMLDSIVRFMPSMRVVLVDNGSNYPDSDGVLTVRTEQVVSYPEALNIGIEAAGYSDWYLILNNDILIEKPFTVDGFDRHSLYGFITYNFRRWQYLAGWAIFISSDAIHDIGLFDPELKPMWFEDADYCIRAQKAGYKLVTLDRKEVGIRHFEDENAKERRSYMNKNMVARRRNRHYVECKHGLV
jgi:GT2 family glycosyltransferase